ncbi:GTP-binding protein [Pyrodictium occultum]|uniref:GTP-binding protein n=1 Tax=Pyrodictium occultum TaxID=2309 RepID=A0A0V8RV52_PYROC|nr:GTPase RsgA [Pyrodictium occultum]KSW11943.1 GTP-binding protein [Pyrodictium occultum]
MILASWRSLAWIVRRVDVVLEVVDARDPVSTRSLRLERMVQSLGKRLLIVINKADLVPRGVAEKWKRILEDQGYRTVYMAARDHKGTRVLRRAIRDVVETYPAIVAVAGFPKTGKSTIINALKGRHSASTSPIPGSPGYTTHAQLYRIGENLYMLDTPGVIPVEGGPLEAIIRGRPPEQLEDPVRPAVMLLERALRYNPLAVKEAYGIDEKDPYRILELIALKRGWRYKSDGEPLIEEAARTVIRDYHTGKLLFYVPPEEYMARKSSYKLHAAQRGLK